MVSPPSPRWQWFLRLAGIILNIAILTITARDVHAFLQVACSPPSKLTYNLATSIISLSVVVYLVFATGPTPKFRFLPCRVWLQPVLGVLLFILWLAAAITSKLKCHDLCTARSTKADISYGDLSRACSDHIHGQHSSPTPKNPVHLRNWTPSPSSSAPILILKQDLNIAITILYLICLTADLYSIIAPLKSTHTKSPFAPNQREKATPAGRRLVRYLFHGTTKSGKGQAPQPLTPPKYPQSAYHQQYFHGSVTSLRTQQDSYLEAKEGAAGVEGSARSEGAVV